jgi:hypothetical protein
VFYLVISTTHSTVEVDPDGTTQGIAQGCLEGRFANQAPVLRALVWRLLDDASTVWPLPDLRKPSDQGTRARVGLAYHLNRLLHSQHPDPWHVPVWLLRAVALAPCVQLAGGEVANRLHLDLGQFTEDCFTSSREDNKALRLLLGAASLRPALLVLPTSAALFPTWNVPCSVFRWSASLPWRLPQMMCAWPSIPGSAWSIRSICSCTRPG